MPTFPGLASRYLLSPDEQWLCVRILFVGDSVTVEEVKRFTVWPGYRRRLSQIMLGLMAPGYLDCEVFCCGPEPFMRAVRDMLGSLGFDMARNHEESLPHRHLTTSPLKRCFRRRFRRLPLQVGARSWPATAPTRF